MHADRLSPGRRRARLAARAQRSADRPRAIASRPPPTARPPIQRATGEPFDVIILDVMLPGRDGFDVARTVRQQGVQTPILMLTARAQVVDRVVGLKLGADDYLTKPFEMIELLARIEALLRRAPTSAGVSLERFQFGNVLVDVRKAEVTKDGVPVDLSAKEFHLLRYFIEHRGATISREELLQQVWGYQSHAIDAHGRRARRVAAAEAGAEPARPAVHPDGSRPRLQVRGLIRCRSTVDGRRSTVHGSVQPC